MSVDAAVLFAGGVTEAGLSEQVAAWVHSEDIVLREGEAEQRRLDPIGIQRLDRDPVNLAPQLPGPIHQSSGTLPQAVLRVGVRRRAERVSDGIQHALVRRNRAAAGGCTAEVASEEPGRARLPSGTVLTRLVEQWIDLRLERKCPLPPPRRPFPVTHRRGWNQEEKRPG